MEEGAEVGGDGFSKRNVGDDAFAKEGVAIPLAGAVKELVWQHDVTRMVFFLEGADGGDGDDPADVQGAEGPNVGAVIEFSGEDAVAFAMTGKKKDTASGKGAGHEGVGRRTVRGVNGELFRLLEAFDIIEAAAANDRDGGREE
jgi:hypothetical protein